ncbi:unnamed protein product [Boreogadus saida]
MSRKKLAWANKEVETFVCILGEEDVVYDVYVAAAAIDIRPTTKGLKSVPAPQGGVCHFNAERLRSFDTSESGADQKAQP